MTNTEKTGKAAALLANLLQQYAASNPESAALNKKASEVMPAGNTRAVFVYEPFPLAMKSGRDCRVTSVDGTEYLDFVSEYFAGMFGHSHPDIKAALQEVVLSGFTLGAPTQKEAELAAAIVSRFPSMDMVQLCTSATEANTLAIAVGLNYTQKKKVLVFERGYHGNTLSFKTPNAMTLPHDFVLAPYNDIEGTRAKLDSDIGVILVEPMQAAGGMIPATREFLSFLRSEATRINAVLIFDEVVTARLHVNGLQSHHNIIPDMTSLGKYIGGGLAFGAYGGRRAIMETLDVRRENNTLHHSGTFHNNLFTMSAGLAACKLLSHENIERANHLGSRLREGMDTILNGSKQGTARVTGLGSVAGVAFKGPDAAALQSAFYFFLLTRKIYMGHRGFLALNIMHEESHIQELLDAVREFAQEAL